MEKEKNKGGRPKSTDPKAKNVCLRMTPSQYNTLKAYADAHDMTVTQAVHKAVDLLYSTKS